MKKIIIPLVCAIVVLVVWLGFSKKSESTVFPGELKNGFSSRFSAQYKGNQTSGLFTYKEGGIFIFELDSPDVLKGLTAKIENGEMTLKYKELSEYKLPQSSSFRSALELISAPLDSIIKSEGYLGEKKGGTLFFKGVSDSISYELSLNGKTGEPLSLNINSGELVCDFKTVSI